MKTTIAELAQDKYSFMQWIAAEREADVEHVDMASIVRTAMRTELTDRQKIYIQKYYFERLSMKEIGELYGVDKSTVSRTISRGMLRLEHILKYVSPSILKASLQADFCRKRRHTRRL